MGSIVKVIKQCDRCGIEFESKPIDVTQYESTDESSEICFSLKIGAEKIEYTDLCDRCNKVLIKLLEKSRGFNGKTRKRKGKSNGKAMKNVGENGETKRPRGRPRRIVVPVESNNMDLKSDGTSTQNESTRPSVPSKPV